MQNQGAKLTALKKIEIMDISMPVCGDNDVVIKVGHVGICGSDIHFFQDGCIGARKVTFPMILGHEAAGEVIETGKSVKHLKTGDFVAIEPGVPCCTCEVCKSGRYNQCRNMTFYSAPPNDGLMARYLSFPAHLCFKLPEGVSTLEGALVEPFSVGLHSAVLGNVQFGKSVVILGSGCIGLMTLLACRVLGASRIIISDLFANRLDNALELGADEIVDASKTDPVEKILELTNGEGADVVIEAAGNSKTAYQTSFVVRNGGCIVLAGNIIGDVPFNFRNMTMKEAELKTVWRYRNTYPRALEAISKGKVDLKRLRVDLFDFEDAQKGFERAMNEKQTVVKAVIRI
jgi:L-iditol 2-dehydrogenase